MDTDSGRDDSQRSQSIADAVGCAHDATMDQKSDQKSDIERQLQQRQQDDRAKRPVEEDDHRAWKLRREYRARRELAPPVKLQGDERKRRHRDLDRERQLQRPDEAGQDQEIDQAEYELGDRFAPDMTRCGFGTRTPAPSRPESASARTPVRPLPRRGRARNLPAR